ncbi:hypothetical protein BSKO_13542 [Bryopsis sp. KO-2023]|nr:hypothetical protein BSKO_13542 [Bryopsis sp. KO-2023]
MELQFDDYKDLGRWFLHAATTAKTTTLKPDQSETYLSSSWPAYLRAKRIPNSLCPGAISPLSMYSAGVLCLHLAKDSAQHSKHDASKFDPKLKQTQVLDAKADLGRWAIHAVTKLCFKAQMKTMNPDQSEAYLSCSWPTYLPAERILNIFYPRAISPVSEFDMYSAAVCSGAAPGECPAQRARVRSGTLADAGNQSRSQLEGAPGIQKDRESGRRGSEMHSCETGVWSFFLGANLLLLTGFVLL